MGRKHKSNNIHYLYSFEFSDNVKVQIDVELDSKTLQLVSESDSEKYPEWTLLKNKRCPNCTLSERAHDYCPVAVNLLHVVHAFDGYYSPNKVRLQIFSENRTYVKETNIVEAMSSLIGIYMVTSGCPVLDKLRPMVRYHLPFASMEETRYRAISMYLVGQYLLSKSGKTPEWELDKLYDLYKEVKIVNGEFCRRLRDAIIRDAAINALVRLDCFAGDISISLLNKEIYDEMREYFATFLGGQLEGNRGTCY